MPWFDQGSPGRRDRTASGERRSKSPKANPQSLNKYAYALNNPLVNTDATGLHACKDDAQGATEHCTSDADTRFEAARQRDLQSKNDNVRRAAAAYGDPGQEVVNGNKVTVGFSDLGKSGEGGVTKSVLGADDSGKLIAISFQMSQSIQIAGVRFWMPVLGMKGATWPMPKTWPPASRTQAHPSRSARTSASTHRSNERISDGFHLQVGE
jgi:hypothetical protein